MKNRVFVIGLDGATFDLIKPWAREGKLPNLSRLISTGVHGDLMSTIHPLSPQAWSSFMTGKNPGKHGIYGFVKRMSGSYDLEYTNATNCDGATIWRLVSEAGGKVGVIDVPFTYPPETVDGFLITGMDAMWDESTFIYPRDLKAEIENRLGDYCWYPQKPTMKEMDKYVDDMFKVIDHRARITEYLMENRPWDFFITVFLAPDRVQHTLWRHMDKNHVLHNSQEAEKYGDVIFRVYQRIDEIIGELVAKLDDRATVVIMSDHGAGPYKCVLNLTKWLNMNGWLKFKGGRNGAKLGGLRSGVLKNSYFVLKKWLPNKLKKRLATLSPDLKHKWASRIIFSGIDWRNTRAYAVGNYGNISINVKGREPLGIVDPGEEYESLREEIIQRLAGLKDPDSGEPILDKVYRREELYSGPYMEEAPDLIVLWKDFAYYTRQSVADEEVSLFEPPGKFGNRTIEHSACHRPNGILIMNGRPLLQGKTIEANIIDLAPTILHAIGLPVPEDMDGKVLSEAFASSYLQSHPVRYVALEAVPKHIEEKTPAVSSEEAEATRQRLRDLGYID
ncbi:MAG: alkaline phosphatase family protein [Thermodesulfobacteriota bacterium]|nr:alkaline phosphatase family protein [Thermodesulfobacteriota bacterium]